MKPNNYVKLSIRGARWYHDADAVQQAPSCATYPLVPHDYPVTVSGDARLYVTTWIFPFVDELENDGRRALAAAEAKCDAISAANGVPVSRFRFTTWQPSALELDSVVAGESEAA